MLHGLRIRLKALFRSAPFEREIEDELREHLESRAGQLAARGVPLEEARLIARRELGNPTSIKEQSRDAVGVRWIVDAVADARYGARALFRTPIASAVMLLTLAIGIGASTAVFGVLDALVFRTLPVAEPDRLVLMQSRASISFAQFGRMRGLSEQFTSMAAIWTIDRFNITTDAGTPDQRDAAQARIGLATPDYFSTMGAHLAAGRPFTADEDRVPGGQSVAVISDSFWRRQFGGTPDVLRRTIRLNGVTYAIVGVALPGFAGEWVGLPTDIWVPFAMASQVMPEVPGGPDRFPRRVLARLAPGRTIEQALPPTQALYRRLLEEEAPPGSDRQAMDAAAAGLTLERASRGYSPQRQAFAQPLGILAAAVVVLLLIACANLANMLLARSAARQRELAVRLAIGAGRGRLVRQLLTESAVLAGAGGALGVLMSIWMSDGLGAMVATAPVSLGGQGTGLVLDLNLNLRVLAYTTVVAIMTGLMFGAAPALSASRIRVSGALNEASARVVSGRRFGPSNVLVVTQVALSLLLLIGAGLFTRTLANLRAQNLGVERRHELLVWTVPGQTGRQDTAMAELWHTVQVRLSALPGVLSAAAGNQAVLSGNVFTPSTVPVVPMRVDGEPEKRSTMPGFRTFITPGYFATLGVPLVAGREFTERDHENAPRVVILNESMARYFFGDRPAVGRVVRFSGNSTPTEIVGVTRDFVKGSPRAGARAEFATYFPYRDPEALNRGAQTRLRVMLIVLRTAGDPTALAETVRLELRAIDPGLPILRINTTEQQLDDVLAQDRLIAVLSTSFGAVAVFLACLGLFGLISYRVTRRTNEIGVRLALGATRGGILAMILAESGRLIAAGLAVGLVSALGLGRLVSSRLYGVTVTDGLTLTAAIGLLLAVAALSALIPARRAAGIDPMAALRAE
jgi:predicted permease